MDDVNEHAALQRINDEYIRSVARCDVAWFERHLAEDFMNGNADGSFVDRATFLRQIGGPSAVPDLQAEDVQIRVMGDFAIIHGRTRYTKPGGEAGAGRYTDIYARRAGRWLCVAAEVRRA